MNKEEYILDVLGIKVDGQEMTPEKIAQVFSRFKEVKKVLESYEKSVMKPLCFKGAEEFGRQTENGGHRVLMEDGSGWEKQARVKVTVDQEKAHALLVEKNLFEYIDLNHTIPQESMEEVTQIIRNIGRGDLLDTTETVSNESLEQLYLNQDISDEELSQLIKRTTTYALVELKAKARKNSIA